MCFVMTDSKCKICRRQGEKLFLKGDRCFSPKCAMVKRPYPPGMHGSKKKKKREGSEFAQQLNEKQKVRFMYGLPEKIMKNYFGQARRNTAVVTNQGLYLLLERRLDNVVFRSGFTISRSIARHAVSYGHIMVNGKRIDKPGYFVTKADIISVHPSNATSAVFGDLQLRLKKYESPAWLDVDKDKLTSTVVAESFDADPQMLHNLQSVVEYYSR